MTRVGLLLKLADAFRCTDAGNWDPEEHPKGKHGLFIKKNKEQENAPADLEIRELSKINGCRRFNVNGKTYTQVKLERGEYALVMSEINRWINKEKERVGRFSQYIDDSVYAILIVDAKEHDYVVVGWKLIE